MSATDWLVCPICKKAAIDFIDKCYGKVPLKQWNILSEIRDAWDDEKEDFVITKEMVETLREIENWDFNEILQNEDTFFSLRVDENIGLNEDKLELFIEVRYECQDCEASWFVHKHFKQGENKEVDK